MKIITIILNGSRAQLDFITGVAGNIVAWLILPLMAITCYEVVARHVFNAPTIWSYELGYMLTGSYFLLGSAYALREDAHIRIDIIYNRLGEKGKAVANLLGFTLIVLPFMVLITPSLRQYAMEAYESGEQSGQSAWNPVVWPFRFTFFVGFVLLTVQTVSQIFKSIVVLTSNNHHLPRRVVNSIVIGKL